MSTHHNINSTIACLFRVWPCRNDRRMTTAVLFFQDTWVSGVNMAPLRLHLWEHALICAFFRYLHWRSCNKDPSSQWDLTVPGSQKVGSSMHTRTHADYLQQHQNLPDGVSLQWFLWEVPIKINRGHSQTRLFSQPCFTCASKHPRRQFQSPMWKKQNCDQTPPGSS